MTLLIVGGGLGGSALAARLAKEGRQVTLIEREKAAHHKVCGEFLSYEAQHYLAQTGIDLPELGAVTLHSLRVTGSSSPITVKLPFNGLGLSRWRLDEALLGIAKTNGAEVIRGRRVTKLVPGWSAQLDDGTEINGTGAVLATGKHDFRGWQRPKGQQSDLVAFKMYFRLSPSAARNIDGHIELMLFPGGYAGLQPVEDGKVNLCLVVKAKQFAYIGGNWAALLSWLRRCVPLLNERLNGAIPEFQKPLAIAAIPYGHLTTNASSDGIFRLGDQAAVIPSFSGDGMSIALHSAQLAGDALMRGDDAGIFHRRLAADLRVQVRNATILSLLIVNTPFQPLLLWMCRMFPGILASVARQTRISDKFLQLRPAP